MSPFTATVPIKNSENKFRVIISGGGTGGHIFPAIAIAKALEKALPTIDILFVGAKGKMEMEKIPQAGFKIVGLDIAGFNRTSLLKNITLPFKIIQSFFQALKILKRFKPMAVIGVGGYASYPVLRTAQYLKIPTFIHESNSFAGKSNVLLAKRTIQNFVASEGMDKFFPASNIIISGNPVREEIAYSTVTKQQGLDFFNLKSSMPTILVIGGSLGATSINKAIESHISSLIEHGFQLIWQTGKTNAHQYSKYKSEAIWVGEFIQDMNLAYAAADLIISRSGALAIAEICLVKKPTIFIPYPFAAENHQVANAKYLVDRNAALMILDDKLNQELLPNILSLYQNKALQQTFVSNLAQLGIKDAATVIASEVLKYIHLSNPNL